MMKDEMMNTQNIDSVARPHETDNETPGTAAEQRDYFNNELDQTNNFQN